MLEQRSAEGMHLPRDLPRQEPGRQPCYLVRGLAIAGRSSIVSLVTAHITTVRRFEFS